ncbi:hypothetical protein [Lysinibacillus sp. SGAir0095]|uniref:hypothetical protein n=1 Tax=Lysinibacillus sp. SGAir0095 TaxID=2070463 RepID=UPI0010F96815|nr:hypothetical protein [Lysinibacillus sp. SGAir0095]
MQSVNLKNLKWRNYRRKWLDSEHNGFDEPMRTPFHYFNLSTNLALLETSLHYSQSIIKYT